MRLHPSPSSTPTQSIRILIADRNRMGNQLLAESLGRDPRFDIVAAVAPAEILPVVTNLQPDLALISADFDGAARIYRRCRGAGFTPRGMVDCMIAAVAWRHGASLLAQDVDVIRLGRIVGIELDQASQPT